jgi:hypothetical protein
MSVRPREKERLQRKGFTPDVILAISTKIVSRAVRKNRFRDHVQLWHDNLSKVTHVRTRTLFNRTQPDIQFGRNDKELIVVRTVAV